MIHSTRTKFSGWSRKVASCVPCIWLQNGCLSDMHLPTSTWYVTYISGFQAYFCSSGFLHLLWWVFVTLSKQPADLVWDCKLVGKYGYTCGFFSSFFIIHFWHIGHDRYPGYCSHQMLIRVHYSVNNYHVVTSVLVEASLKMEIKSVPKTQCVIIQHIWW